MTSARPNSELTNEIVSRASEGDEVAISIIWRSLQPALLRYLRSLGLEGAQDVASIVWIELARALPKLSDNEPDSVRKMLFTIARRRQIDEFRRRGRDREVSVGEHFDAAAPEESRLDGAMELLRHLPANQAEVIALRTIVGLSAQEVGELTGQSAAAVRVMAHRGLTTLRGLLDDTPVGTSDHLAVDDVTNDSPPSNSSV